MQARELERLLREFKPRNGAEHFDANIGVMHALYECLLACTPYFVDSGQDPDLVITCAGGCDPARQFVPVGSSSAVGRWKLDTY